MSLLPSQDPYRSIESMQQFAKPRLGKALGDGEMSALICPCKKRFLAATFRTSLGNMLWDLPGKLAIGERGQPAVAFSRDVDRLVELPYEAGAKKMRPACKPQPNGSYRCHLDGREAVPVEGRRGGFMCNDKRAIGTVLPRVCCVASPLLVPNDNKLKKLQSPGLQRYSSPCKCSQSTPRLWPR